MNFQPIRAATLAAFLILGQGTALFPAARPVWAQKSPDYNVKASDYDDGEAAGMARSEMLGHWQSQNGDRYLFRSNGTYTFSKGDVSAGNVSHSGTWRLGRGGKTLRLLATRRVVLEGHHRRTLRASKTFVMDIGSQDPPSGFLLSGQEFGRPRR